MRKKAVFIIIGVLIVAGLAFLLFEPVSYLIEKQSAINIAEDFDSLVERVNHEASSSLKAKKETKSSDKDPSPAQLKKLYDDSKAYNEMLAQQQGNVSSTDYKSKALDLSEYGIDNNLYCYISAPSIDMKLPVYLGAGEEQLSSGAAHLCGTSLPLDMNNTNCAIAGHTGYFGRIFFDNIRSLNKGEELSVKNYWQTVRYKVVDKKTVVPTNTSDLKIKENTTILTLITCIKNDKGKFDRCLVICEKV